MMLPDLSKMLPPEFLAAIQSRPLYIFGAGKMARIAFELCKKGGVRVKGFCVTDAKSNRDSCKGFPVVPAEGLAAREKDAAIAIAVLERGGKKIERFLRGLGFTAVASFPKEILGLDP